MSRIIKKGATSQSLYFDVFDSTSSTGGRKTGLAYNTSSLIAYYVRNGAASVQITLVTLAAASTAWASGGFKEVDATGAPGVYRLDVPDAAFASGVESVVVTVLGATGMVMAAENVQLVAVDLQDAVRGGMTSLPNAAAEAAGGLYTRGTGAGQINQDANGRVDVSLKAILGTALTETAGQIAAGFKKLFDVATPVLTAASVNQTGDAYARLGAPAGASSAADVAAIKAVLPAALVSGRIDASVGAMAAGVLTATAIAADAITAAKVADGTIDAATFAAGAINAAAIAADAITDAKVASDVTIASVTGAVGSVTGAVGSVTGNVGGNVTGSVGSVATGGIAAASFAAGAIDNAAIATDAIGSAELASSAVTEIQTGLATSASIAALNNLSAAQVNAEADTALADAGVTTTVTGRIDVAISTRLASGSYTAPDNATISAINAKTTNLPSDPADESLIIAATDAIMTRVGAPVGASISADIATKATQTSVDDLPTNAELTTALGTADDAVLAAISALTIPTASANAAALLASAYESSESVQDFLRLARAVLYGKANALNGTTTHYRDATDTKNRVTATVDPDAGTRVPTALDAT